MDFFFARGLRVLKSTYTANPCTHILHDAKTITTSTIMAHNSFMDPVFAIAYLAEEKEHLLMRWLDVEFQDFFL